MRERLKEIVEQHDTPAGRVFDLVIQALILTSLASFSIETLPRLSPTARSWLAILEVVTVAIFTIEYLLRLWLADRPLKFALSFYGLIDLIAVLPFYLSVAIDLRSIRAIRFLRLFRAFKMVRYSRAIQRFHRAFIIAREELVLFSLVALLVLYFAAVGIYYCESAAQPEQFASVFHSRGGRWRR